MRIYNFFLLALLIISCDSGLFAQSTLELNVGSVRPLNEYDENNVKEGMWDFSVEWQKNLREIFTQEKGYFPLSIGMKVSYNYYLLEKEKWDKDDLDSTFDDYIRVEFKYKMRSHVLSFHPLIEVSTPLDNRFIAYAKYYFGPSTMFTTATLFYELEDSAKTVKGGQRELVEGSRQWTFDHGLKLGAGYSIGAKKNMFITISFTHIWGGEIEYLGKGSIQSFDRTNPENVEVEYLKSNTNRMIFHLGIKFLLNGSQQSTENP